MSKLVVCMTSTSIGDQEIDEVTQKIMTEIEHKSSKELAESDEMIRILHLTNMHHTKTLLQHLDEAQTRAERNAGKQAVIKALLLSMWHQRLYFIIRSFIWAYLVPC
jgi:phosphopantetheinyl transferase (holo-ACP synthase)